MFKLDDEKKKEIIEKFGVKEAVFDALSTHYGKIKKGMKKQYLAHMIRTIFFALFL